MNVERYTEEKKVILTPRKRKEMEREAEDSSTT